MAKPKIDYALELGDAPQAVQSRAGELTIAASQKDAAAINIEGKANADLVTFLGTTAIDAYKGKLEAGVADGTDEAIDKFMRPQQNIANARDEYQAAVREAADSGNPVSREYIDQLNRFVAAQETGALTRTETIDRISAEVKKYSAMMPGWAADFRKIAAEKTGISNIDVYGVHQALTQKGLGEKRAEKQQEIELNLLKEVAQAKGYTSLSQVTDTDRMTYAAGKQMQLAAARITAEQTVRKATQDEADKAWGQVHQYGVAEKAMAFAGELASLGTLSADPTKGADAARASLQLSTKIGTWIAQVEANIADMTKPVQGRTPLSPEEANKMRADWRTTAKAWQDAAKEVEGREFLGAAVKSAKNNVELLLNNFKLANPHLTTLNTYGSVSELTKAWFSLGGDKKEFGKRFTPDLANAMEKVFAAPQMHATVMGNMFGGNVDLPGVAQVSPELAKVCQEDGLQCLTSWNSLSGVDERKAGVYANVFANTIAKPQFKTQNDLNKVNKYLSDPKTASFFEKNFTAAQRTLMLAPLLEKMQLASGTLVEEIKSELAKYNDRDNSLAARNGAKLVVTSGNFGQMKVEVKQGQKMGAYFGENDAQAATGFSDPNRTVGKNPSPTAMMGVDGAEAYKRVQVLVNKLNTTAESHAEASNLLDKSVGSTGVAIKQRLFSAIISPDGLTGPVDDALSNFLGNVPKSAPKAPSKPVSAADFPRVSSAEQAQRDAEAVKLLQGEAKQRLAKDGRDALVAEVSIYEAQLQNKDLDPTVRKLLTKELQVLKFALNEEG